MKYFHKKDTNFRKKLAGTIGSADFTREECTLKQERGKISTYILISKALWVFHCERCNVDHNSKKRINQALTLKKDPETDVSSNSNLWRYK